MEDIFLSDYGRASTRPAPVSQMMAAFAAGFHFYLTFKDVEIREASPFFGFPNQSG